MYNILICDDEQDIVNALKIYLSGGDYCLFEASNGREAMDVVEKNDIHLILMDIMMPQLDGIAATAKLREKSNVPIILLTAKSESSDKVLGLNIGADDYMTKPFSVSELLARIEALCRRVNRGKNQPAAKETRLVSGKFVLDEASRILYKGETPIDLTQVEFQIMELFFRNQGTALVREKILEGVWGPGYFGDVKIVDVNIRRLRMKIEDEPSSPKHILTVWGYGYRWNA